MFLDLFYGLRDEGVPLAIQEWQTFRRAIEEGLHGSSLLRFYHLGRSCLVKSKALTSPVAPGNPYPPYGGCGSTQQSAATTDEGTNTNHLVVREAAFLVAFLGGRRRLFRDS